MMEENTLIKAALLNAGGLIDSNKQIKLITFMKLYHISVLFITESHIQSLTQIIPAFKPWIRCCSLSSPDDSHSGLLVLAHPSLTLETTILHMEPRHLVMDLTFQDDVPHTVHLVYGPHKRKSKFWHDALFYPDNHFG